MVLLYLSLLIVLIAVVELPPLPLACLAAAIAIFATAARLLLEGGGNAIYLPSVVIPLFFGGVFIASLLPGRVPIITRIAVAVRGGLPDRMMRYSRQLTRAWVVFFLLISAEALALAIWAPLEVWSLFTNVLNYVFIFTFFVLEYAYRKLIVKEEDILSFSQYIRALPRVGMARKAR
ncbi:MAG: hypothetical protein V3S64_01060 [bacterium]